MSTLVDELRAELARAHQDNRELRATRACAEGERDAALAHAEELTRALSDERLARARAEAAMDERGLRLVAVVRERDGLRAIIEGRTVPPTREECATHEAAGGWWLVLRAGGLHAMPAWARHHGDMRHWWAIDSAGRLCAWPTTEAPRA